MNKNKTCISTTPIHDIDFSGLHWIEASAGSGKTFTLSSLMVRILLEQYLPRQVIATTFTRAAAAELKTRIRKRLQESYAFFDARRSATAEENLAFAQQCTDPLQAKILSQFAHQVGYACERLKLVIDQLDELFVGTLDSFSQKLLREFAFESGKIEHAEITDQAKQYTRQLVHDILREWIQAQPQHLIDWLYISGDLGQIDSYVGLVEKSLNFTNAQFKTVQPVTFQVDELLQRRQQLSTLDLSHLAEFYLPVGEYFKGVSGTYFKKDSFTVLFSELIPCAVSLILREDGQGFFSQSFTESRNKLFKFVDLFQQQKIFSKKCPTEAAEQFYADVQLNALLQVLNCLSNMQQTLQETGTFLKFYLCQEVKKRLPQLLLQHGETTFSQQIRTLAEALQGEQGQKFAAFVQNRYPLILVDEFQDTNQDQDDMLASIWRHPQRYRQSCMIMVGDRKQAIYGFRGGDMLTFIKAHQDVQQKAGKFYQLIYNQRSIRPLVEVVDALFQRQPDFGEQVLYYPVQAGHRPHPALMDHAQENPQPLRWLSIPEKQPAHEQVAWQIRQLLNQSAQGQLYFAESTGSRALIADDIAVLSKNHDGLDQVHYVLERLGIRVNRPAKRSVFDSQIAKDVAAVLTAILEPYHEAKLKRALLSRLFGLTLKQLVDLQAQADGLSQYILEFDHVRELWLARNFLTAWQYLLQRFAVWQTIVASQSRDNERVVVNLRHLTELLSQHSGQYQGAQNLYHWYMMQVQKPSDREWELERKLSTAAGVQLMTIHQSKGLEFKIVFLLNADGKAGEPNKQLNFSTVEQLNPQTQQLETQRVIAIHDRDNLPQADLDQHQLRLEAEQRRLWYVALTRASYRVYAVLQDHKGTSTTGLAFWKNQSGAFEHPASGEAVFLTECPKPIFSAETQTVTELQALPLPQKRFYPRARTSFTGLAQHLSRQQAKDLLAEYSGEQQAAEDEWPLSISIAQRSQGQEKLPWIQRQFPQGPHAGNFLHGIFEHLDFQQSDDWHYEIRRRFKNDDMYLWQQLLERYQQRSDLYVEMTLEDCAVAEIQQWLTQILVTPIHADFCLQQLEPAQHLAEFPFFMALSDQVFAVQRLHALFKEYGLYMPEFNPAESARYLNGAIDLVYEHQGRFYIADYKSNYLGDSLQDYSALAIQQNMSQSSYWLQASIYLVALHRYLQTRLENYAIEQHLGGASYLYLRGMSAQAGFGSYYWRPEPEFILRLDAILGYMYVQKNAQKSA
ncbi:exonuclease V subunit beta [Acinetobacter sp. ANC 4633]|uniref:UvrD-helicase domain-containing protein n=1 Tax=Acinetobacter sp. ANC 4633 TaxID=2529845 RepID=UPI001038A06A|nr:UvrD-helicase domain-containing protein [Acinetobacter sp. ANC 4633]TCB26445.1 exonuclease V subunit beta [Acinetobacter sp. ANC 4633]